MGVSVGIGIDLIVDNKKTLEFLERITNRMKDLRPLWRLMHEDICDIVYQNIRQKGRPPWPVFKNRNGKTEHPVYYDMPYFRAAVNPGAAMWADRVAYIANVGKAGVAFQYGVHRTFTVPSHTRKINMAFGRPIAERTIRVKAYQMTLDLPGRPYFCIPTAEIGGVGKLYWTAKRYLFLGTTYNPEEATGGGRSFSD